jgi:hypothetical protein
MVEAIQIWWSNAIKKGKIMESLLLSHIGIEIYQTVLIIMLHDLSMLHE